MVEQRYQAVLAVIGDGRTVSEVASQWAVSRQTVHGWLARYEHSGLEGLADRSHRPAGCPHQMTPELAAVVLELRRGWPFWGPRRLALEPVRRGVEPAPSESAVAGRPRVLASAPSRPTVCTESAAVQHKIGPAGS